MTKQWEDHRHIIIREYKDNNKPLHEVKKFMEERYRFKASIRAYRSRFDRWRVRKYTCRKPPSTTRRRGNSLGAKSDSYSYSSSSSSSSSSSDRKSVVSVRSESLSDDSSGSESGTGSPLRVQRSHLRRISSGSSSSLSPQTDSSIHYIGSGMYESTTSTPASISTSAEDFLT
ncbi:Clr5 domain-containing protein [Sordaria brevicollis]|uniref:Clr5 domain-containing protein n=1 Tax=Sordaria brevicollis TaxID=83679 RepID=A0AAE0PLG4_SORBR|nr:Clr5 domain-containing protein [Sordaria brevicollis]